MGKRTDDASLTIRGHHLLCLFGFRGLGYSPQFVENMTRVAEAFFSTAAVKVRVVAGRDDICRACPHMKDGDCAKPADAFSRARGLVERDLDVLERLGIAADTLHTNASLRGLVCRKVVPGDLPGICAGCEWLEAGYCAEGLAARRRRGTEAQQ